MQYTLVDTDWGTFGFVSRGRRLVATMLPETKPGILRRIKRDWPDAVEDRNALPEFRGQVVAYFTGAKVRFTCPIDLTSFPPFRAEVLKACRRIPYGKTTSYGDLAMAAGSPGAARAVGGAMAHNPLPLVIPCHRVLCSDGSIGGFSSRSGVSQKKRLLALENVRHIGSSNRAGSLRRMAV